MKRIDNKLHFLPADFFENLILNEYLKIELFLSRKSIETLNTQSISTFSKFRLLWKNGQCAQFVLSSEDGNLTVKTSVNLGSWIPPNDADRSLRKAGPSCHRRRERRAAAARAATDLSHPSHASTESSALSESPASIESPVTANVAPARYKENIPSSILLGLL